MKRYILTDIGENTFTKLQRDAFKDSFANSQSKNYGYSDSNFNEIFPNSPVSSQQNFDDRGNLLGGNTNVSYNDSTIIGAFKRFLDKDSAPNNNIINSPDFVGNDRFVKGFANTPSIDLKEKIDVSEFSTLGGYDAPLHGSPNLSVPDINKLPNYETESSADPAKKLTKTEYYYKVENIDLEKSGGYGHKTLSNSTKTDRGNENIGKYMGQRENLKLDLGKSWIVSNDKNSNTTYTTNTTNE